MLSLDRQWDQIMCVRVCVCMCVCVCTYVRPTPYLGTVLSLLKTIQLRPKTLHRIQPRT